MHYEKTILQGIEGQVTGKEFYLSEDGKDNPQLELEATLKAFLAPTPVEDNLHSLCRFPARRLFLQRELGLRSEDLPQVKCSLYKSYQERLNAESVSYVFSSYYLNNPGSSFGHTLLRMNKKRSPGDRSERNELLDYGIGYAAEVTTENPVLFALLGIVGGFRGLYSNVPYYYKVREYNDFEARDLFSYDLTLTPSEIEMLVAHLWEVGGSHFTYYFFTQNCAYHLLTALEAAAPRLDLVSKLPYQVIPSDSIKVLVQTPGLISRITYRPSVRARFFYELEKLSLAEKEYFRKIIDAKDPNFESIPNGMKAKVLDTALDYLDFKIGSKVLEGNQEAQKLRQHFLIARAAVPVTSERISVPLPKEGRPDEGHGSRRTGLEIGHETRLGLYTQASYRFAVHDILDLPRGYPVGAALEFFNFKARLFWTPVKFDVEEATLFEVSNLNPLGEFRGGLSWRGGIGLRKIRDEGCDHCLVGGLDGGAGANFAITPTLSLSTFIDLQTGYSPKLVDTSFRLRSGPTVEINYFPVDSLRLKVRSNYSFVLTGNVHQIWSASLETRWHLSPSFALNGRGAVYQDAHFEAGCGFFYYY